MDNDDRSSRTWRVIAKELSVETNSEKVGTLAEELNTAIEKAEQQQKAKQSAA